MEVDLTGEDLRLLREVTEKAARAETPGHWPLDPAQAWALHGALAAAGSPATQETTRVELNADAVAMLGDVGAWMTRTNPWESDSIARVGARLQALASPSLDI